MARILEGFYIYDVDSMVLSSTSLTQLAPKATQFGEICNTRAIMLYKVIQGHLYWYQSTAHMRLLSVINTNILSRMFPSYCR